MHWPTVSEQTRQALTDFVLTGTIVPLLLLHIIMRQSKRIFTTWEAPLPSAGWPVLAAHWREECDSATL
eukprot:4063284-Amphidinium_carterae.1